MNTTFKERKPELAEQIDQLLWSNPALEAFPPLQLGDDGFAYLLENLKFPVYSVFKLNDRGLTNTSIPKLVEYITSQKDVKISGLDLSGNRFTPTGIVKLIEALKDHPKIEMLKLDGNSLAGGGATLARLIAALPPQCTVFSAEETGLNNGDFDALTPAVAENKTLRTLQLSGQNIDGETAREFLKAAIQDNTMLEQISFKQPHIDGLPLMVEEMLLSRPNFNLQMVTPVPSKELVELFDHNSKEYMATRSRTEVTIPQTMQKGQMPSFTGPQIREMERQKEAVFIKQRLNNKPFYETFIAQLPSVPEGESGFAEALFTPDNHGYAPLDNPRLWPNAQQALQALERIPLEGAFLSRLTERRSTIIDAMLDTVPASLLMDALQEKGVRLTRNDLLDGQGKPTPLYEAFIRRREGGSVFNAANWLGQPTQDLRAVHAALPAVQQSQVGLNQLLQQMASPVLRVGRGR